MQDNQTLNKHDQIKWITLGKYRARWWTLSCEFFSSLFVIHLVVLSSSFDIFVPLFHAMSIDRSNAIHFIDITYWCCKCASQTTIWVEQEKSHDIRMKTAKSEAIEVLSMVVTVICGGKTLSIAQLSTFFSLNFTYQILPQTLQTLKLANIIFFLKHEASSLLFVYLFPNYYFLRRSD